MQPTVEFLVDAVMQPLGLLFGIFTPRQGTGQQQQQQQTYRAPSSAQLGTSQPFWGYRPTVGHTGGVDTSAYTGGLTTGLTPPAGAAKMPGGIRGGLKQDYYITGASLAGKGYIRPTGKLITVEAAPGIAPQDPVMEHTTSGQGANVPVDPGATKRKQAGMSFRI